MPKRRLSPPLPPRSVPSKKPASRISAVKTLSTLESVRARRNQSAQPSVLLIDDEETIVVTWAEILTRHGMQLGTATSVQEALRKVREREWDVIVTDLQLGDGDGVTILNEIYRKAPATISIVLTGFPTLQSTISAIRAGVHDYLIKPCKIDEMLASIRRGLAKREAIQSETIAKRASMEEFKRLARLNIRLRAEVERLRRRSG